MATRPKNPKSQFELSTGGDDKRFNRSSQVRRDDDTLQEFTVGLADIDYAIKYYFDKVIRPFVNVVGSGRVPVPVVYGSPEKWKNIQSEGYVRDREGKIQCPLISYKRTGLTKNRTLSSKVDANFPQLYYSQEVKFTQENRYDQFSALTNSKPVKTYVNVVIPEFVEATYDVVVWTDYISQMNTIVEDILYSEGSYWGDMESFKFRTKVDNWANTTDLLQDADRVVRTTFQLTLSGAIVPSGLVKELSKKSPEKSTDFRQVVMETVVDSDPTVYQEVDRMEEGLGVTLTEPSIRTTINPLSLVNASTVAYLNTNKAVMASTINPPDTVHFTATMLTAPEGMPATSVANFSFFINGQYVEPGAVVSFTQSGLDCILTFNLSELGFTVVSTDEIVAIGKFA